MNIKQNYSAYWNAFKPFLNSLPTDDIIKIANVYFGILGKPISVQEKCILVQELITTTKQKYIKLKTSSPKQSYVLEDWVSSNSTLIFPHHLKLRTYRVEEWISVKFDTIHKIKKLLTYLPEDIKSIGLKEKPKKEEVNSVINYPGLTIYPIVKCLELNCYDEEGFKILTWLLKILINNSKQPIEKSPIFLSQHGRFNTKFWKVYR